jgi:hypothetical protein
MVRGARCQTCLDALDGSFTLALNLDQQVILSCEYV